MVRFALIGAAGYIAPRHMKAIKETGNELAVALDRNDSVGIIDSYFPEAHYFLEFERFDRHIDKLRRKGTPIDYVTICSPNYLHDAHIRFALKSGADVICEKPLVINPWNLDGIAELAAQTGRRVNTILQLRLHPQIIALKKEIEASPQGTVYDIDLTYITCRGRWYQVSWKGDEARSGGVVMNIGVHFFDMLLWIFGGIKKSVTHRHDEGSAAGYLELERARVRWFLSIDPTFLPPETVSAGKRTFRSITVNGRSFEFSEGFTDLHTRSYEHILAGHGAGIDDARPSIEAVYAIRQSPPVAATGDHYHPFLRRS